MKSKFENGSLINKLGLAIVLLLMAPLFASCGMHHNIKGKVINAQTGEPVQGAVVAIKWIRYKLAPPGYPTPKERYGTTEDITDAQGGFTIPKYTIGTHFMGVYKTGYVCWSSDTIFNPDGENEDEIFVHRWENVKNGMVVELEPKSEDFPWIKHASFIQSVGTKLSSPKPKFNEGTKEEYKIYMDNIRRQMRENSE